MYESKEMHKSSFKTFILYIFNIFMKVSTRELDLYKIEKPFIKSGKKNHKTNGF